jgi:hypothetical protein
MDSSNSIINLGDLSKPANTLIEKISEAIGGIFKPHQIRRVAQAEAEADKIHAVSQIEISELQHRAMQRFFIEEAKKQNNIESITSKALPLLEEKSKPEKVENDWITNFFDKCRLISDDEMQIIWSKILAGESNAPGKFSKRTIDLLASMDKNDAELFAKLCSYCFNLDEKLLLIYDCDNNIYNENGINFSSVTHLESIGLIKYEHLTGYIRKGFSQKGYISYYDEKLWVEFPNPSNNEVNIGNAIFTQTGKQLSKVCEAVPVIGFRNFIKEKWQGLGYKVFDEQPKDQMDIA